MTLQLSNNPHATPVMADAPTQGVMPELAAPQIAARGRLSRVAPLAMLLALAATTQPGCFPRKDINVPEDTGSDRSLDLGDQPDSDGDGCTDAYEEATGSDPNDPTDCGEGSEDPGDDTDQPGEDTDQPGDDTGEPGDTGIEPSPDNDGDGVTVEDGDCDDGDPSVHPGAEEIPGDTTDSDCDGDLDNPDDDYDGDGITNGAEMEEGTNPLYPTTWVISEPSNPDDWSVMGAGSDISVLTDADGTRVVWEINPDYISDGYAGISTSVTEAATLDLSDPTDCTAYYRVEMPSPDAELYLSLGTDSSNKWSSPILTTQIDGSALIEGANTVGFDLGTAVSNGSPDSAGYLAISLQNPAGLPTYGYGLYGAYVECAE